MKPKSSQPICFKYPCPLSSAPGGESGTLILKQRCLQKVWSTDEKQNLLRALWSRPRKQRKKHKWAGGLIMPPPPSPTPGGKNDDDPISPQSSHISLRADVEIH